jgi:transcriptional regulator with XRE-family HTH domain
MSKFSSTQLRLLRFSRQMKQEYIAFKMGISKQRYSELENHKNLRPERVVEILKILGYTVDSATKYLDSIPPPPRKNNHEKQELTFID